MLVHCIDVEDRFCPHVQWAVDECAHATFRDGVQLELVPPGASPTGGLYTEVFDLDRFVFRSSEVRPAGRIFDSVLLLWFLFILHRVALHRVALHCVVLVSVSVLH